MTLSNKDIEHMRAVLAVCDRDLLSMIREAPSMELNVAQRHLADAVKALSYYLKDKAKEYADEGGVVEFKAGLNSGTNS